MARPSLTDVERSEMRQRLADAAFDIAIREGADAVSFRVLADTLGISHTLIYRYFENKDALFAHLRCDAVRRFEAFVRRRERPGQRPMEHLRTVFAAYIEYVRAYPGEYLLILAPDQPPPDRYPDLLAARQSLFDHAKEAVQACVDAGMMKGDTLRITHAFWIGLHGLMTLHGAGQLVHGCDLDDLAPSLLTLLIAAATPQASDAKDEPQRPTLPASSARPARRPRR